MQTGIIYALIAGLFWGTSPVLVKRGLVKSDVSTATLYQQASILLTLVLFTAVDRNSLTAVSGAAVGIFAGTGIVGAYLGRTLFVRSVAQIGASRAQSLNNAAPLVTVLLSAIFLGERLTTAVFAGVVLILSGVFTISRTETPAGEGAAARALSLTSALAVLCYGVVPVLKKLGTDSGGSPVLGALVMHATGLVLLLTCGSVLKIELRWQKVASESWICFIAAGMLQAIGSILTLQALVHAPASVVAPIWNTQPIVSFFLARLLLKRIEAVTIRDGLAAALVVGGIVVLRWA